MKAVFTRTPHGLAATSDEAQKILAQYQPGDDVLVEHKRGRNARNHRRFFAFVSMTFDWQDDYQDIEVWRKVLEIAAGHFDVVIDKHGNTHYWPKSIAWDELDDETEFRELFGRVVNAYLARYGSKLSDLQVNMAAGF